MCPKSTLHSRYSEHPATEKEIKSEHESTYCFLHQESLVMGEKKLSEINSVLSDKVDLHSGTSSLSPLRPTNISQICRPHLWATF